MERVGDASKSSETCEPAKMRNEFEPDETVPLPPGERDASLPPQGKRRPDETGRGNQCTKSPGWVRN